MIIGAWLLNLRKSHIGNWKFSAALQTLNDDLTFSSGFPVVFLFPVLLVGLVNHCSWKANTAGESQEWLQTVDHLHVRWWKPWCLSRSKLSWIRDAGVCFPARNCSELHGCFCVFAPRRCNLSRAAPQMSYFYLFVLNTHGWPWKTSAGTSKRRRIWSRLMSPDGRSTSLQLMERWNITSLLLYSPFCHQVLP